MLTESAKPEYKYAHPIARIVSYLPKAAQQYFIARWTQQADAAFWEGNEAKVLRTTHNPRATLDGVTMGNNTKTIANAKEGRNRLIEAIQIVQRPRR